MTAELLKAQIARHRLSGARFIGIVLRDGSTVLAEQDDLCMSGERNLVVTYTLATELRHIDVPVSEIAGTHPFSPPALAGPSDDGAEADFGGLRPTVMDMIADNALAQATVRDFETSSETIQRMVAPPAEGSLAGDISFEATEVLYCDASYLLSAGGLNGISPSTPFGGLGISWAPDVRNKAKRRIKKKPKRLADMCSMGRPGCVSGFLEFVDLTKLKPKQRETYVLHVDEGPAFVPAYLRMNRGSDEAGVALVYFRDIWGPFPPSLEAWERHVQPARVFGEVVHAKPPLAAWSSFNCYMRARCAGVVV